MSAPTITAPAPSTDAAWEEGTVARPVPAPPKRRQPCEEASATIAVTSLADDSKLIALAEKLMDAPETEASTHRVDPMVELAAWRDRVLDVLFDRYSVVHGDQLDLSEVDIVTHRGAQARKLNAQEQALLAAEVVAPSDRGHLKWLLGRLEDPFESKQSKQGKSTSGPSIAHLETWRLATVPLIEFIKIWDGEVIRNLTGAEQSVLEVAVSKETYSHVKRLYKAARAVKHVKVDKKASERQHLEALRLQMLASEGARTDLATRRIRFSDRVIRPLAEVEHLLLVTPVSNETDLVRLEKLIGFVEASRSAYFGTKGRAKTMNGAKLKETEGAGVKITEADRRALRPVMVATVVSPDTNGYGKERRPMSPEEEAESVAALAAKPDLRLVRRTPGAATTESKGRGRKTGKK